MPLTPAVPTDSERADSEPEGSIDAPGSEDKGTGGALGAGHSRCLPDPCHRQRRCSGAVGEWVGPGPDAAGRCGVTGRCHGTAVLRSATSAAGPWCEVVGMSGGAEGLSNHG